MSPMTALCARANFLRLAPRFGGVRVTGPDPLSTWGICVQIAGGEYDLEGLRPLPGQRVIDIGANIGLFSLWASHLGAATVAAYEPGAATFSHLTRNTGGHPGISAINAAVVGHADEGATVRLYLHDDRSTRNTILPREIGTGTTLEQHIDVRVVGIDEVLRDGCDLLKVDCEGAEFDIFAQVSDQALSGVTGIVVEFHRTAGDPDILLDRLRQAGFIAAVVSGHAEPFGVIGATRPV
jgi:FkbM family methyltransferase